MNNETQPTNFEGWYNIFTMMLIGLSSVFVFMFAGQFISSLFFEQSIIIEGELFVYGVWIITLVLINIKLLRRLN